MCYPGMCTFIKHLKKGLTGLLLCLLLIPGAAGLAGAEETASLPAQEIKAAASPAAGFTIQTADLLMNREGLDTRAWDEAVSWEKANGLSFPVTEDDLRAANPDVRILRHNGRIYMIDGAEGLGMIQTPMEACRAVYRLAGMLGAAENADLRLWSEITAPSGHKVFVFQQVYEGLTVIASTVKIVTGEDGNVTAVFSSLSSGVPESTGVTEITAEQAENIVRESLSRQGAGDTVMPEFTSRAVMPLISAMDDSEDTDMDVPPDRLVWIVYSENPRFADSRAVDLPYLAHYVGEDGVYLHSSAVAAPGRAPAMGGFPAQRAFEYMEKGEWSGTVYGHADTKMDVTVPVMRDTRTGMWYLGDPERRIAVAEFAALAYGDQKISFVASAENGGWDDEDLITYCHLIKAWDFYADMGWVGPDGIGSPTLLLRGMCLENGEPVDNAAYCGWQDGWQCFAYGKDAYLGQALDIFAHEFTHVVTASLMNTNLYLNDYGAINEALSDIMGNLCERQVYGSAGSRWLVGEQSGFMVRSMLDPHLFDQPEYVWDLYYAPPSDSPNSLNDRGGVHVNSSLLNLTAARLCEDYGMSTETAVRYWLTVASCLTPGMDYPQMAELLKWAVPVSGCAEYREAVSTLIAETRMAETGLPEVLAGNRKLVRLALPDSGDIADEHWILMALQLDLDSLQRKALDVASLAAAGWKALWGGETEHEALSGLMAGFRKSWKIDEMIHALEKNDRDGFDLLLREVFGGSVVQHITWRSTDGSAAAVMKDLPTVYLLMNLDEENQDVRGLAVLIGDHWYDLLSMASNQEDMDEKTLEALTQDIDVMVDRLISRFTASPAGGDRAADAPAALDLPAGGLENLRLTVPEAETENPQEE